MSVNGQLQQLGITPDGAYGLTIEGKLKVDGGITAMLGKGKVFYVSSGSGSDNYDGETLSTPKATLDAAIGKCVADRGDLIVILPAHAENIAAATTVVCDIAGVTILGLGTGSLRPKFTFTAAAGTITVSAANVTFQNIVFEAAFADVAEAFTPTAKYLTIKDCAFQASAADKNFVELVDTGTTNNQCDGLAFIGCSWIEPDLATTSMINLDADCADIVIKDCYLNLGVNTNDLPALVDIATGKDVTNIRVENNKIIRLNDANPLLITGDTTTALTGILIDNVVFHADTSGETLASSSAFLSCRNYGHAVVNTSGYLIPAVDS